MCGINDQKVAIVIFLSLPIGLESTVQFVGHVFRLSSFWARVNSTRISSTTRLRQRHDYSRDLDSPDREQSCLQSRARFKILTECGVTRPAQPSGWRLCHSPSRMLKKSASGVLASLRGSTRVFRNSEVLEGLFRSPRPIVRANGPTKCGSYLLASSLAAALLDGLFEHPASCSCVNATRKNTAGFERKLSFPASCWGAMAILSLSGPRYSISEGFRSCTHRDGR